MVSPLQRVFLLYFTVPVFPIHGSDSTTAVESRAVEENHLLRRAVGPALIIYNTAQHPPPIAAFPFPSLLYFVFTSFQIAPTPNAAKGEV